VAIGVGVSGKALIYCRVAIIVLAITELRCARVNCTVPIVAVGGIGDMARWRSVAGRGGIACIAIGVTIKVTVIGCETYTIIEDRDTVVVPAVAELGRPRIDGAVPGGAVLKWQWDWCISQSR